MEVRSGELERKEILSLKDGSRIGYADHLLVDLDTASVRALVVCGRLRWFGLLGREPDLTIPWQNIEVIGEDAILVRMTEALPKPRPENRARKWLRALSAAWKAADSTHGRKCSV